MQQPLSSIPQPDCLSLELTGIPIQSSSADTPLLDLYLTLDFNEAWQSLMGGRFKFGIKSGQLKLKLENGQMPEESRLLNGDVELRGDRSIVCAIATNGSATEPCWHFAVKKAPSVLKGSLEKIKLGTLKITSMPCLVQAVFEVSSANVQLTETEGLWLHDITPNKHTVLERLLAISIVRSQLKPHFSRTVALHYHSIEEPPHKSSEASENLPESSTTLLAEKIQHVVLAKTNNFVELSKIAGLNPLEDFAGATFLGATLTAVDLSGANLAGANLRGADLCDADLSDANLAGANLAGADLSGVLLSDANLAGADLHRCSLALATLSGANLAGANLRETNLSNANLSDADLTNANLVGADLHGAGLMLTNLTGADLKDAKVQEARFRKDSGLSEEMQRSLQQRGAIFEDL